MTASSRVLSWEGCVNVRDLGGLRTDDARRTRFGAVVRSDNPAYLTQRGWASLHDYGIRTVIGLRTIGADDYEPPADLVPSDVHLQHVFVEDITDREFLETRVANQLWGTPLYFADALRRWPAMAAEALAAVATARPGGVVVSCGRGCDRTGFVAMLLLHVVGVRIEEIADDYAGSEQQMLARDPDYANELARLLALHGTSVPEAISQALAGPVTEFLLDNGLSPLHLRRLRERLVAM